MVLMMSTNLHDDESVHAVNNDYFYDLTGTVVYGPHRGSSFPHTVGIKLTKSL